MVARIPRLTYADVNRFVLERMNGHEISRDDLKKMIVYGENEIGLGGRID